MDAYLRDRAEKLGAKVINGLMMKMEQASEFAGPCIGNLGAPCCFCYMWMINYVLTTIFD